MSSRHCSLLRTFDFRVLAVTPVTALGLLFASGVSDFAHGAKVEVVPVSSVQPIPPESAITPGSTIPSGGVGTTVVTATPSGSAPTGSTLLATGAVISLSQMKGIKELRVHLPSFRARFSGISSRVAQRQGSLLQAGVLQGGAGCLLRAQSMALPSGGSAIDMDPQTSEKSSHDCIFEIQGTLDESIHLDLFAERDGYVEIEGWQGDVEYKSSRGILGFSHLRTLNVDCGACDVSGEFLEGPFYFQVQNGSVGVVNLRDSVTGNSGGDIALHWEVLKKESMVNLSNRSGDIRLDFPKQAHLTMDLKAPRAEIFSTAASAENGSTVNATANAGSVRVFKH